MKQPRNNFLRAIRKQQKQIGLWVALSNNYAAEVVADSGFDWVLIDAEHSPTSMPSLLGQLQALAAGSSTVLVRPAWNDPVLVKGLLDLGVQGLLFPMIQSVEEAERAVAATRYPPRGIRGVAGVTRATKFGRIPDYPQTVEQETAVFVQLETISAVENAEAIAAVEGVDGVFFGPADIAADMGLLGQPMSKDVWGLIRPVARLLAAKGVPVGTLVLDSNFACELLQGEFSFVAGGSDVALLARGADKLLAQMRAAVI
ncbi:MAG: 4-hydroxy-2-oxo-heptane-1,7-dioate aldolase [Gammaproteobacteria bacterium]|nr:4-hydroxy-2-oxo-heptane-1,7-dioate aldolase [Gammaproteobacteria bacterium]